METGVRRILLRMETSLVIHPREEQWGGGMPQQGAKKTCAK